MYACTSNSEESIKYLLKKKVGMGGAGKGQGGRSVCTVYDATLCAIANHSTHTPIRRFLVIRL